MQTIEAPPEQSIDDQWSLTEAVRPSPRELVVARRYLHLKAVVIGMLAVGSYWSLVVAHSSVVEKVLSAVVLVVALTAAATSVFHDANHASFSTSRPVNRLGRLHRRSAGRQFVDLAVQAQQPAPWQHQRRRVRRRHRSGSVRPAGPDQPWHPWHRYQHLYMWVLYGFLTLQWFLISDWVDLTNHGVGRQRFPRRPRRRDVAMLALGKMMHVGWAIALPLVYHRWWVVLTFYLAISWTVGLLLATMFQLAHCAEPAEFFSPDVPRRGSDFVAHQLRTTVDVHCRTGSAGERCIG